MAKAKINGLDEAIEEVYKDYKKAIKKAAQEAINKAKDDLHAKAVSCLVSYYNDYDPTSYDRTYSLIESFVPYADEVKETRAGLVCRAGVIFDPNRIAGAYSGSEIYTPTDGEWIISNFLAGIHPRTDGYNIKLGTLEYVSNSGNYEKEKYQGSFVPAEELQKYIDRYYDTFDKNYRRAIAKQVLRKVR